MNIFIKVSKGYSYGGYGGYAKINVIKTKLKKLPTNYWNNHACKIICHSGKVFNGLTERCEAARKIAEYVADYPSAKIVY